MDRPRPQSESLNGHRCAQIYSASGMERSLRAIMDVRAQMGSKPSPYAALSPSAGGGHADWHWARMCHNRDAAISLGSICRRVNSNMYLSVGPYSGLVGLILG